MSPATGITVILSTYNRANDLRTTLEAFCALDRDGLDVEFVVVDNNSNDGTPGVIDEFRDRLPLVSLFCPTPGKNRALNHALDRVALREIVVFTDDDLTPAVDWLRNIDRVSREHPEYSVFGGKTTIRWPGGVEPLWASERWIQVFAFGLHDFGDEAGPYPDGSYPFGANLWVRSAVFANGLRYNERVGPQPKRRLMGSETSLLLTLESMGHRPFYAPSCRVEHRVQPAELNTAAVAKRASRLGRSAAHVHGVPEPDLLVKSRPAWALRRIERITFACLLRVRALITIDPSKRFARTCAANRTMAWNLESMRLVMSQPRRSDRVRPESSHA